MQDILHFLHKTLKDRDGRLLILVQKLKAKEAPSSEEGSDTTPKRPRSSTNMVTLRKVKRRQQGQNHLPQKNHQKRLRKEKDGSTLSEEIVIICKPSPKPASEPPSPKALAPQILDKLVLLSTPSSSGPSTTI